MISFPEGTLGTVRGAVGSGSGLLAIENGAADQLLLTLEAVINPKAFSPKSRTATINLKFASLLDPKILLQLLHSAHNTSNLALFAC